MKDKEITYPRFLDNKPCKEDLFKGQSHKKIAQNIANVLENNNVKIIGIDGGWGSGKSNMVYLLKDILEKTNPNKYRLFIYDAWGHQEDLCRRSILEELTESLTDETQKAILNNNKWKEKLNNLLSKKRKLKTKTIPKLSCGIIFSALAVVITPILNIVTSNLESICCKVLITSVPLLGIVLYIIISFIGNLYRYFKKKSFLWCLKCTMTATFNIYTDKQKENTILETISEEEASSREFRSWMHEIDEDLGGNVVIIVFDNMDRLPTGKVQELWASIHTFFADEDYKKIKVIVPFDRKHIKSAFKSEDINNSKCYGNDFINKTFDAIYRVSPPVMSDWKLYFVERWKDAFNSDVSNKVTQIYDLLSDVITPREIIAFINEFVSIRQISDSNIPDEYIALFIFGKDVISDNPNNEILAPSYIGPLDFMYKNDLDLPKFISALYYQLPPEEALDTIYTEKLKQALDDPNKDQMESLQSNENLFFPILENAITKITNIPNAVQYLEKCLKNKNPQKEQVFWDCIYDKVKQQPIIEPLQQYQKILLTRITNKDEYLKKILLDLYNIQDLDIISYYDSIKQLSEIDDINPYILLKEKEANAKSFVDFVEQAKDEHAKYKIICKQDDLNKYFSELNVEDIEILNSIPFIKDEYTLDSYKQRLQVLLDENYNIKNNIKIVYDRLKEIERPIRKQLSDDIICNYFNSTKEDNGFYYDLICMRIARLNNFNNRYQSPFDEVLKSTDNIIVEKVAERVEYYINYGKILLNVDKMNYPLYKEVAKKLTEKPIGKSEMDIVLVLQNYEMIKDNLEIDINVLIERLDSWSKFAESKITVDNINSLPIIFFKDIMTIENNLKIHCVQVAEDYLKSQTKEVWKNSIQTLGFVYELLLIIKPDIQASFDAFKELLLDKAKGSVNLTKDICMKLIQLFETNERSMLNAFSDVRDSFCTEVSITNDFFDFYAEWLFNYAKLEDRKDSLRRIFPTFILDKEENISLILNNQDKMFKIVEKAGEENKDFNDKIKSLLAGKYKDNEKLKVFANKIGVILDNDSEQVVN